MIEHRIRLRGGWQCRRLSDEPSTNRIVTLPIQWTVDFGGPLRLARRFGCPTVDPARESVSLIAEDVPGLLSVQLNDEPIIATLYIGRTAFELHPLLPRNELVLDVDPNAALAQLSGGAGWGHVSLVVRRLEDLPPAAS